MGGHICWRSRRVGEDFLPDFSCDVFVLSVDYFAAGVPIAAEVDITILLNEGGLEGAKSVDVVVEGGVGVPSCEKAGSVRVEESEGER